MRLDLADPVSGGFSKRVYTDSVANITSYNSLAFTMDGTTVQFYQNGQAITTVDAGVTSLYPSTDVLSIGAPLNLW